ncbi:MAG: flagellar biosynthetic protein FliR [Gemmatimonadetes bacterium]|nr:flagellar biosynthetic protein FliR [Gemmatimonadota bacterium]
MVAQGLDRVILTEGSAAALLGARLGGLMLAAPMFSSRAIPVSVRAATLIVLTAALFPSLGAIDVPATPTRLLVETGVGLTIGLAASLYIAGATAAGDLLAIQMGLSASTTLNPVSGESLPILGQFAQLMALTIVLSLGGHLVMIEAVRDSLVLAPIGAPIAIDEGLKGLVDVAGRVFVIALRFAAPVIGVLLVGNVVLGVLGRAVPQMNLLMVAFPVQIGIGLLALAGAIPILGTILGGWPWDFEEDFRHIMSTLGRT